MLLRSERPPRYSVTCIKMLKSPPEDALVKLVKTVEIVETAEAARTAHTARTEISHTLIL